MPAAAEPPPPAGTAGGAVTTDAPRVLEPAAEPVPPPDTAVLPSDPPLQPVGPLPRAAGSPVLPERPVTGFGAGVAGVVTGRLPRIGDTPTASAEAGTPPTDAADRQPIERFARKFENPEGKPTFAIILIDAGEPGLDRGKLAALPFPVTFALDPALPDVARLAAVYRSGGQEIVMLASSIPAGARAADLEITFEAHAAALPEAVGVVDLAQNGFQGNRPLATQIVPIIKGQGRGLLTYDEGLNAAAQVASREQVRAGTIFRRIDPPGEPVSGIRHVLDRAAFKAAQVGRVAVIGEASPETVAALLEWSAEGRAASVALAPATAVMLAP